MNVLWGVMHSTEQATLSGFQKGIITVLVVTLLVSFMMLLVMAVSLGEMKVIESLFYIILMAVVVLICRVNVLSITIIAVLATIATDEDFIFKLIGLLVHDI